MTHSRTAAAFKRKQLGIQKSNGLIRFEPRANCEVLKTGKKITSAPFLCPNNFNDSEEQSVQCLDVKIGDALGLHHRVIRFSRGTNDRVRNGAYTTFSLEPIEAARSEHLIGV
ncbi:MAG: hypothetical protein R8G34_14025 [Paracoccaceae bacterium]|nr:hypothetical protein [Paracoccaceae bacterium]